jgi:hypothetical protein
MKLAVTYFEYYPEDGARRPRRPRGANGLRFHLDETDLRERSVSSSRDIEPVLRDPELRLYFDGETPKGTVEGWLELTPAEAKKLAADLELSATAALKDIAENPTPKKGAA